MKITTHTRLQGSALLLALLTAFVICIALTTYLYLVSNQNRSVMRSLAWNSSIPVVEAGVEEALTLADKRFVSSVYFHALFLYMITRNRKYGIVHQAEDGREVPVDLTEYLKDLFQSYYSEFLLNFEMEQLIATLEG